MNVRRVFLLVFALVVAVAAAYSSSFQGQFVLDDYGRIIHNGAIRSVVQTASHFSLRYIADLTLAIDYARGGLNPAYYHFTNIMVHLLCVIVLFLLVRALLLRHTHSINHADWTAFVSALLWGLHPLATSAVTYICQRYESLMSLFYLLAMFCFVLGAEAQGWKGRLLLVASVFSFLCGVFTKQVIITAPVVLLMLDVSFFSGGMRAALRRRWLYYSGLCLCWIVQIVGIRWDGSAHAALFESFSGKYGAAMYLINQAPVLLQYLRLSIWPHPLMLDYAWQPILSAGPLVPFVVVVGGLLAAVLYGFIRWPRAFFSAFCVFVILSPTSSVIPIPDLAFEHRMYLPLAALVVSFVLAGSSLVRNTRLLRPLACLVLLLSVVLGVLTFQRNRQYADPEAMWGEITDRIPDNFRAWSFLISEKLAKEDYSGAEMAARNMLSRVSVAAATGSDRYNIPSSNPQIFEAFGRNLLGRALMGLGREQEALTEFSDIVAKHPDDHSARNNRALALLSLGRKAEAEQELDATLRIAPGHLQASMVKSHLLADSGRHLSAASMLEKIIAAHPRFVAAQVELAWLRTVSFDDAVRDPDEARRLIDKAEGELGASGTRLLDIRAALQAESGDFAVAVQLQRAALSDAEKQYGESDPRIVEIQNRLELYKNREPYRYRGNSSVED